MIKFSKEKVLLLHQLMAEATGGSVGVRDEGLLDLALEGAFAGFGDEEFYPTKEEKGARLNYTSYQKDLVGINGQNGVFSELHWFPETLKIKRPDGNSTLPGNRTIPCHTWLSAKV